MLLKAVVFLPFNKETTMSKNIHDTLSPSATVTADPFLTDSAYRHEARQALNVHLEACYDALQHAGVTPPEWPALDDKTVSGLAAQMLWLNRWIVSFDPSAMKPHLSPVPVNAFILTKEQIQKNIKDILPGYRLIEKSLYEQLTAKEEGKPRLNVDFSHRIVQGDDLEDELLETLSVNLSGLVGMVGALAQLLQTTEENKLCASIAGCMEQELNHFDALVAVAFQEKVDEEVIAKLNVSLKELYEMNGVLIESLGNSEKDRFGSRLAAAVDQKLQDSRALLEAYIKQSQLAAEANKAGAE
jgi:hypothetical protein